MSRSVIPPSKAFAVLIIATVTPIVLATCRPFTRWLGEEITKVGEALREYANQGTDTPATPPKADVSTPSGPENHSAAARPSSPTGKTEVDASAATSTKGTSKVEARPAQAKRTAEAKPKPDQPLNPKRTTVTPPKTKAAKPKQKKSPGASA